MNDKRIEAITKIATGLNNELVMAINDFRRLQNGANVHHMAQVLTKVQAVLSEAQSIKERILEQVFSQMKNLSKEHGELFAGIDESLKDGKVSKEELSNLRDNVQSYKKNLDNLMKVLEGVN